jgi:hypothetical protein
LNRVKNKYSRKDSGNLGKETDNIYIFTENEFRNKIAVFSGV